MRTGNVLISAVIVLFLAGFAGGCAGRQVKIPRASVQKKVEKKFPIERNVVVARAKLYKPEVHLEDGEVGIRTKFRATLLNREVKGKADVRGTVAYDHEKKQFFVEDLHIVDVVTPRFKLSALGDLKNLVGELVAKRIEGMVVYTMDESKRKERYAATRIEKVEIDEENDLLIITLGRKR
jgi:hypothetical protein